MYVINALMVYRRRLSERSTPVAMDLYGPSLRVAGGIRALTGPETGGAGDQGEGIPVGGQYESVFEVVLLSGEAGVMGSVILSLFCRRLTALGNDNDAQPPPATHGFDGAVAAAVSGSGSPHQRGPGRWDRY